MDVNLNPPDDKSEQNWNEFIKASWDIIDDYVLAARKLAAVAIEYGIEATPDAYIDFDILLEHRRIQEARGKIKAHS